MALKDLCTENRLTMHAYSAFRSNRREPVGWDAYSNIWGRSSIIEYINRHLWMKIKVSRYAGGWLSSPRYSRGTGGIIKSLTMPRLSLHPSNAIKKRSYEDSVIFEMIRDIIAKIYIYIFIAWKRGRRTVEIPIRSSKRWGNGEFENRALPSNPTGFDPDNRRVGCRVTNLTRFHGEQGGRKKGEGG